MGSHLLLPHIPPVLLFLDVLLLRTRPAQARFLQSQLLRIGTSAQGGDAIDSIIDDLDARLRQGRKCLHDRVFVYTHEPTPRDRAER